MSHAQICQDESYVAHTTPDQGHVTLSYPPHSMWMSCQTQLITPLNVKVVSDSATHTTQRLCQTQLITPYNVKVVPKSVTPPINVKAMIQTHTTESEGHGTHPHHWRWRSCNTYLSTPHNMRCTSHTCTSRSYTGNIRINSDIRVRITPQSPCTTRITPQWMTLKLSTKLIPCHKLI